MVETVAKPLCAKLLLLTWIPHSFSWTSFTCNIIFTKFVFNNILFCEGNIFRQKKLNIFWNFIKNKVKVTLGVFLSFVYDSSYLETKKVPGYFISFEPQMVRSSNKDQLSKLNIDRHKVGCSKVTYRWRWRLLTFFGDNCLENSRQDLKAFYSYDTSSSKMMSHSSETLAVKLLGKICMQYLRFRIILLTATNLKYCFWLVKFTLDGIFKIKIRVT